MTFKHYKRENWKFEVNFFIRLFFRFHRTFFGSLIKRGRKLWAFNFSIKIKINFKKIMPVNPNAVFFYTVTKISPCVLIFLYRIGGKFREVALNISWYKKIIFATKWIIKLLIDTHGRVKLRDVVEVMVLSVFNKGLSMKKRYIYCKSGVPNRSLIRKFKY